MAKCVHVHQVRERGVEPENYTYTCTIKQIHGMCITHQSKKVLNNRYTPFAHIKKWRLKWSRAFFQIWWLLSVIVSSLCQTSAWLKDSTRLGLQESTGVRRDQWRQSKDSDTSCKDRYWNWQQKFGDIEKPFTKAEIPKCTPP